MYGLDPTASAPTAAIGSPAAAGGATPPPVRRGLAALLRFLLGV